MRDLFADLEVSKEVVDCLSENMRPVDRVDGAEMALVEGPVRK